MTFFSRSVVAGVALSALILSGCASEPETVEDEQLDEAAVVG